MNRLAMLAALGVLLLLSLPFLAPGLGAWAGSDGQGVAAIQEQAPEYEPWIDTRWSPPSGEVESVLFSVQAGLGGAVLGYVYRGWTED